MDAIYFQRVVRIDITKININKCIFLIYSLILVISSSNNGSG